LAPDEESERSGSDAGGRGGLGQKEIAMTADPTKMANELSVNKAHQAIGAYFCAFSELEREVGEAMKVVLKIETHVSADTIVRIVQDFARKTRVVREAIKGAKNADGSETTSAWKGRADKMMAEILDCNNDRVSLAHDYLEPHTDGSVSLHKSGQQKLWGYDELDRKVQKVKNLTEELRALNTELTTLTISIPELGWMTLSGTGGLSASADVFAGDENPPAPMPRS
jgi:hypothetical protein